MLKLKKIKPKKKKTKKRETIKNWRLSNTYSSKQPSCFILKRNIKFTTTNRVLKYTRSSLRIHCGQWRNIILHDILILFIYFINTKLIKMISYFNWMHLLWLWFYSICDEFIWCIDIFRQLSRAQYHGIKIKHLNKIKNGNGECDKETTTPPKNPISSSFI